MEQSSSRRKQSKPARTEAEPALVTIGRRLPLWLAVAGSGLTYWLFYRWFPLFPDIDRVPPADIRTFLPDPGQGFVYGLLLIALFGLLMLAVWRLWVGPDSGQPDRVASLLGGPRRALLALLVTGTFLAAPLVFSYPVNSTDVFRYVISGRLTSVYEANPFVVPRDAFPDDPYLPLAGEWAGETSPYGPVWEGVTALVTGITAGELAASVLGFKLLGLFLHLACAAVIWMILDHRPWWQRAAFTALWAWNPTLLLTFVGNAHNDALMLFFLLSGVLLLRRGAQSIAIWVMALAVLTKPVAVLVIPFFFLAAVGDRKTWTDRIKYALLTGGGALVLTWLVFWPWSERGSVLMTPVRLGLRLVREATESAGFSLPVATWFALEANGFDVTLERIGTITLALFLLFMLWLFWRCWQGRSSLWAAANAFLGYLYQALSFRIWYTVWPFGFLLLAAAETVPERRSAYRLHAGMWLLLTSQLSVLVYGHLRVWQFDGAQPPAHFVGVTLVFILPWLLALLSHNVVDELASRPFRQKASYDQGSPQLPGSR